MIEFHQSIKDRFSRLQFLTVVSLVPKVAFLSYRLEGGGTERAISRISSGIDGKADVSLLLMEPEFVSYSHGGRIVDVSGPFKARSWSNGLFPIKCMIFVCNSIISTIKIRKWVKENKVDTVLSFLPLPNLLNVLSFGHSKKIVSVRNHMTDSQTNPLIRLLISFTHKMSPQTISVSCQAKEDLIENFGVDAKRIRVIYNPIPVEQIKRLSEEPLDDAIVQIFRNPVVINMARLTNAKGQEHLIRSFFKVKKSVPDVKLVLIGKGPDEIRLRNLAESLDLSDDVLFLGNQENPFKFIARSSVFVLSSIHEGFPNALVEAMACGVPVISTDCRSGPREILEKNPSLSKQSHSVDFVDYGILTPTFHSTLSESSFPMEQRHEALAEAVIILLNDDELKKKYSDAARLRADDFRIEKIVPEWAELIG